MSEVRLIDANVLLKSEIERCHCVPLVCTTDLNGIAYDCNSLKNVLDRQPTIEPEVLHAKWVADSFCSHCDRFPTMQGTGYDDRELIKYFEYCPHCGAKMTVVIEDEID